MFSKSCEYGIRSIVFIAIESAGMRRVDVQKIAIATGSPVAFTAKILQILSKNNFIESFKGPKGGFFMDKNQRVTTTLQDIVNAIDGDSIYKKCGIGLKECSESHPCPVHNDFKLVRAALETMLKSTSIEKLAAEMAGGNSFLKRI